MAKKTEEKVVEDKNERLGIYEVGYHIIPTIAEESLGEEVTSLKDLLSNNGAVFVSDEYPKLIELAYEMTRSIANKKQKFTTGYFGWVKFECSSSQAKIIKELLDKNEKLIRYLMIKTVRENTMSVKRTYNKPDVIKKRTPVTKAEPAEEINEETIDKEIEALVV